MMTISKTLFLGWCMLPSLISAQTKIDPLGSSGKFRISDDRGASDPNSVVVECDYVAEILADGSQSKTHQNPTMANQQFTISGPTDATIGNGVDASLVTFETDLELKGGGSTVYGHLQFDTYIIEEAGTVTTDTETFDVKQRDVKFNIILANWTFDTSSEYVDVALIIKGKSEKAAETEVDGDTTKYDLGGNIPLILSGRVVVDGVETDMPDGYPALVQNGNKYTFIFRFPKFTDTAVYDPIVGYSAASCWGRFLRSSFGFKN